MKDPDYDHQFGMLIGAYGGPAGTTSAERIAALNEADHTQHAGGPLVYCGSEPGATGHVEAVEQKLTYAELQRTVGMLKAAPSEYWTPKHMSDPAKNQGWKRPVTGARGPFQSPFGDAKLVVIDPPVMIAKGTIGDAKPVVIQSRIHEADTPGAILNWVWLEPDDHYRQRVIAQLKANGDAVMPEDHTAIGRQLDFLGLGIGLVRREAVASTAAPTWTSDTDEGPTHVDHTTISCPACKASWLGAEIPPAHRDRKQPWIAHHTRAVRVYSRDPKAPDMMKCPDCDQSFPTR